MAEPEISVAIPVRNGEGTIGEQLTAVLSQECSVPFEVVVADNGSTDRTRAIVESFRDPRVRIVDASARAGEPYARNMAAAACSGPYLAFCDADDVVRPGWLRAIHAAFASGAHAVSVTREQWTLNAGLESAGLSERLASTWIAGGAFGVRRDLYEELGGFDTSMPVAADTDFGFRLRRHVGRDPVVLADAVVSVRVPHTARAVFSRSRRLGRSREILRRRYPEDLPPEDAWGVRRRAARQLLRRSPRVLSTGRLSWFDILGFLVGDLEGSVRAR